jgi:hypothetical protein
MGIIDDIKSVAKTIQQAGNIELYEKILNLQGQALELVEENGKLRSENRELSEKLHKKDHVISERNVYWVVEGDQRKGPFCPICYGKDDKLIPITLLEKDDSRGWAKCHVCSYFARHY